MYRPLWQHLVICVAQNCHSLMVTLMKNPNLRNANMRVTKIFFLLHSTAGDHQFSETVISH